MPLWQPFRRGLRDSPARPLTVRLKPIGKVLRMPLVRLAGVTSVSPSAHGAVVTVRVRVMTGSEMDEDMSCQTGTHPDATPDICLLCYYNLPYLSHQCAVEEIIYPRVPSGVMSKTDWHGTCPDPACECLNHDLTRHAKL